MVHVFSKRDGPRREDVEAKQFIQQNRGTIEQLANHLSGGRWQQIKRQRQAKPEAAEVEARRIVSGYTGDARPREADPHIRISPNDRVILVDLATGRQMHFLGELRGRRDARRFVLATAANGFFGPLDDELGANLADLDGFAVPDEDREDDLRAALAVRLGLANRASDPT